MHEVEALVSISGEVDGSWDGSEEGMSAGTGLFSTERARYIF
jgi:hypothetical protein